LAQVHLRETAEKWAREGLDRSHAQPSAKVLAGDAVGDHGREPRPDLDHALRRMMPQHGHKHTGIDLSKLVVTLGIQQPTVVGAGRLGLEVKFPHEAANLARE